MKNNPSALSGFYRSSKTSPHTLRMQVELREPIDLEALQKAAEKTRKRYDYFSIQIIKEENEPLHSIVSNPLPIVIKEGSEPVKLLSEESNQHAIALCVEENTIYADGLHSIMDGSSLFEWLKTLLYYYLEESTKKDLSSQGIRVLEDKVSKQEREDPFLNIQALEPDEAKAGNDTAKALQTMDRATSWNELVSIKEGRQAIRFSLDEKKFMDYVRSFDSTPAAVLANLFAKAIFTLKESFEHPIRIVLMKNYRQNLGVPESHHNITGNIALNYDPSMKELDLKELIEKTKPMIAAQSSDSYALGSIQKRIASEQKLFENPDLAAVRARMQAQSGAMNRMLNLTLSYMNLSVPQALQPAIRSLYSTVDPSGSNVLVEVAALQNRFFFSILQNFISDELKEAFFKELKEAGLEIEEEPPKPLYFASMDIPVK